MLFVIEIDNSFRIVGRCNLILVVIGYISFTALLDIDVYLFSSMANDLPFKQLISASARDTPPVLTWDFTTS